MPRNIEEVINQIKPLIPEEFGLNSELDQIIYDSRFTAPEVMPKRWLELCILFSARLPNPKQSGLVWVQEIADIVRGAR